MDNENRQKPSVGLKLILTLIDVGVGLLLFAGVVLLGFLGFVMTGLKGSEPFFVGMTIFGAALLAAGILQWFEKPRVMAYGFGTGAWLILFALVVLPLGGRVDPELTKRFDVLIGAAFTGGLLLLHAMALYSVIKVNSQQWKQLFLPACFLAANLAFFTSHTIVENKSSNVFEEKCFNDIHYLCADWGPNLDAKDPDHSDEVIYFIKTIQFSNQGREYSSTDGPRQRMWFCKMNWDGSSKREICELWPGENPIGGNMWLSVCSKARKAAFSCDHGSLAPLDLWMIDLDGKNLRALCRPQWSPGDKRAFMHPGLNPNAEEIVYSSVQHDPDADSKKFAASGKKSQRSRLEVVHVSTGQIRVLTDEYEDDDPSWSPNGDWLVYKHTWQADKDRVPTAIWLIRPDGSENKPIVGGFDPLLERLSDKKKLVALYPTWSHDGNWIYASGWGSRGFYIIDAKAGKTVVDSQARINGEQIETGPAQLGQRGLLFCRPSVRVVPVVPPEFETTQVIDCGHSARLPAAHFGDLSDYILRWGEPLK